MKLHSSWAASATLADPVVAREEFVVSQMVSSPAQVVLTRAGREHLRQRIAGLRDEAAEVAARLKEDHDPQDLAERQRIGAELSRLEDALHRAVIVEDVEEDPTVVEVGDEVGVEMPDGSRDVFSIVHPVEAQLDDDRISSDAPLAQAVLGHRSGDRVTVQAPAGVYGATIIARRRLS